VLNVLSKVATRTAYLELLHQNAGALDQLVKLCAQSVWVAEQLAIQPILLDELIDPRILYNPTPLALYQTHLNEYMMRVPEDDMEQQLESLRHFKLSHQLRIAAADIAQVLDVAKVSDHLTALSEAIMDNVVNIAWKQMVERYGEPAQRSLNNKGFGVIAYGKMGGEELGYDSDLDVVFVHNCGANEVTNGKKSIDSRQFYLKLSQRIVHIFTSRTVTGVLYEIDNRLRPQGNSGLLACHIDTYEAYLAEEAWTWEHQALVRTRLVYGDQCLSERFADIRGNILQQPRDLAKLKSQVVDMRKKMRDNLAKDTPLMFDLKQGFGGIADIEFITQYLVLAYSKEHHDLSARCANIELFGLFAEFGIITESHSKILAYAYRHLRDTYHRLSLQRQDKLADNQKMKELSGQIQQIWQAVFA
jgi:glutamate-ammonia-ligase adenylyltransferase